MRVWRHVSGWVPLTPKKSPMLSPCSEGDSEKPGRAASSSAGSSVENGLDEASLKQWSEADLIALAEHMQQELDVRDR